MLIYGMGVNKLARTLNCSREEAEARIKRFEETYPAAAAFRHEAVAEATKYGYSFTVLGRRRNIPEIASYRKDERAEGERKAVNTSIQGSGADVVKMAQLLIDRAGVEARFACPMLLQVHDELVFECPEEAAKEALEEISDLMSHPFFEDLAVPLTVDGNHGPSWGAAK